MKTLNVRRDSLPGPLTSPDKISASPNGRWLACATSDDLLIWDIEAAAWIVRRELSVWDELVWLGDELILPAEQGLGLDRYDPFTGQRAEVFSPADQYNGVRALAVDAQQRVIARDPYRVAIVEHGGSATWLGPWGGRGGYDQSIEAVAVASDGTMAIVADDLFVFGPDGVERYVLKEIGAAAFSPDATKLVTASWDGAQIRDAATGDVLQALSADLQHFHWSDAGLLGWDSRSAAFYDDDGEEVWGSAYHDGVRDIAVAGPWFFTTSQETWIGQRDLEAGMLQKVIPSAGAQSVEAVCFADDETLFVAGRSGHLARWDLAQGQRTGLVDASSLQPDDAVIDVHRLRWVHDIRAVDTTLQVCGDGLLSWPLDAFDRAPEEEEARGSHLHDDWFCETDWDEQTLSLFRAGRAGEAVFVPIEFSDYDGQVSADGQVALFSTRRDRSELRLWDITEDRGIADLQIDGDLRGCGIAPDGTVVGWVYVFREHDEGYDETFVAFRWDARTGTVERWLEDGEVADGTDSVAWLPDGRALLWGYNRAAVCEASGVAARWEVPNGVRAVAVSPSGRIALATAVGAVFVVHPDEDESIVVCTAGDGGWWADDGEVTIKPAEHAWLAG